MSNECDRCGLEDSQCNCLLHELSKRVDLLENQMLMLVEHFNMPRGWLSEFRTTKYQENLLSMKRIKDLDG
jgi:hypothetical protein